MATSLHRAGLAIVLGPAFLWGALLLVGGCGDVVVQGPGGGGAGGSGGSGAGGAGGGGTAGSGGTAGTAGSNSTGTGGDTCTEAGGMCIALVPDNCMNGMWLDANQFSCGTGDGVGCCLVMVCTPGQDQTCNAIASMSSFAGKCEDNGTCTCFAGFEKNAEGKCG